MARRSAKKVKISPKKKGVIPTGQDMPANNQKGQGSEGVPYVKLLFFIAAILAFLYGPSLFKKKDGSTPEANLPHAPEKSFLVKKVLHVTGDDLQKGTIFANDVVAVGPNEFAITDNLCSQVLIVDLNGKLVRRFGKNGIKPKDFSEPSGVATDHNGHLFVLDTMNRAIKTFDMKGNLQGSMDFTKGGYFVTPRRLAWGGNCFLLINTPDPRLSRLSLKGEFLGSWGDKMEGRGGLWGASKPYWDGKNRYYISDMNQEKSRLLVFDGTGNVVQTIKTGVPSDALAVDSKGRIFAGCYGMPAKVFDAKGDWLGYLVDEAQPGELLNQIAGFATFSNDLIVAVGGNEVTIYKVVEEKEK